MYATESSKIFVIKMFVYCKFCSFYYFRYTCISDYIFSDHLQKRFGFVSSSIHTKTVGHFFQVNESQTHVKPFQSQFETQQKTRRL